MLLLSSTLADDLESKLQPSSSDSSALEETAERDTWTIGNVARDSALYTPLAALAYLAAGPAGGLATLLTPIGLGIGKYLGDMKKGVKTQWGQMRKTLAVGNYAGAMAYWAYHIPDFLIPNPATTGLKIAKTLLFNPLMVAPWVAAYRTATYIVDTYGGWGTVGSIFTGKIFSHMKEAYDNDVKEKLIPILGETFLTLSAVHFYTMNYLVNPVARVAVGAVNDVIFSLISGEEGLLRTIGRKLGIVDNQKQQPQLPARQPSYA